ncbi:MAG: co-chaperone YbbN [Kordiimonadaceae bacterium]|jgi:putative thioredoxin|nr:co-chaperone YbbN [Kordiimonadaceae bacterium]MBT6031692.1 co-chaperone YbbN [Kordiimonadaceae bacterium]
MQETDAPNLNVGNIIDVDTSSFIAEVVEKSMEIPVVVNFWAPSSEPCKTLGPVLEKVITQAGDAVRMAKVNINDCQEIATQMQIRSVPTVVAFVQGRPVDAFAGVKTESEISEFIAKIAPEIGPSEIDQILEFAENAYGEEKYEDAGGAYSQALQLEPDNAKALAGLASCLINMNDLENAEHVLSGVTAQNKNDPAITAVQATLDTAKQTASLGDVNDLLKAIKDNPDDYQARFDLALSLWSTNNRNDAADHLLYIIAADKDWQEDGARKQLLKFFDMAGHMDPFTLSARRKLSSLLYS